LIQPITSDQGRVDYEEREREREREKEASRRERERERKHLEFLSLQVTAFSSRRGVAVMLFIVIFYHICMDFE
jgi:hypothetical protein